ncbi:hypothetical protein CBM2633_B10015 [Cupriavidus taiwanensis]|nr:hypothetical protein CBM2633_B10015 [Cupriavidus taiwanensis]
MTPIPIADGLLIARSLNRLAINSRQGGGIYGRAAPQLRDGCWHFMSPNVIGICLPLITTRPEVSALTSLSNLGAAMGYTVCDISTKSSESRGRVFTELMRAMDGRLIFTTKPHQKLYAKPGRGAAWWPESVCWCGNPAHAPASMSISPESTAITMADYHYNIVMMTGAS